MNSERQESILKDWLKRHRGLIVKTVRSYAQTAHDRDDLYQEIVLQLWKSARTYSSEVAESTWIYRVCFYTAISWLRKESSRQKKKKELVDPEMLVDQSNAIEDPRIGWLYEQIALLEPIDRSLALMMLDGLSYKEMSQTLGISESNVGVRINRFKQKLSSVLERENEYVS